MNKFHTKQQAELPTPKHSYRDACTEGDKEQKRQGVAFVFIATAVVNQTETTDEAGKFHNLKDNN